MNDVRELCLKPSPRSPSRWPFAIAAERPLKCNARSLLGDNYARQRDSRRLRRCNRPLGGAGVGKEGRGLRRKLEEGEGRGQRTIELAKIIKSFLLRRFPLFLSLLFARRMEGAN